jgi:hypothetical protein
MQYEANIARAFFTMASVAFITVVATNCRCTSECPPCPSCPSVSASPNPSVDPPSTDPPEAEVLKQLPEQDLQLRSMFGTSAELLSKKNAENWTLPYPHQVRIFREDNSWIEDCGFFPTLQGDGWRTAYCLIEDNQRVAHKLYIRVRKSSRGEPIYDFKVVGPEGARLDTSFVEHGQETSAGGMP